MKNEEYKYQEKSILLTHHQEGKFLEMGVSDHFSYQEYHKALDKALDVAIELQVKHWYFEKKSRFFHIMTIDKLLKTGIYFHKCVLEMTIGLAIRYLKISSVNIILRRVPML